MPLSNLKDNYHRPFAFRTTEEREILGKGI